MKQKKWFKMKRYGYGWQPASKEGWLVLLAYVLSIVFAYNLYMQFVVTPTTTYGFITLVVLLTLLLIWICYKTGEKPRWRWG